LFINKFTIILFSDGTNQILLEISSSTMAVLVQFNGKGKAIPLQTLTGPEVSRRLRLPDFKTVGTSSWQGCQPYAPAAFTPRKYSWYSFLLEAESTPGPLCGRKEYVYVNEFSLMEDY
jgi:hypothetical protein